MQVVNSEFRVLSSRHEASASLDELGFNDAVLNSITSMVFVIDRDERLLKFNTACETLSGYGISALSEPAGGANWWRLIPAEEMPALRQVFARLLAGENSISHASHWRTRDGSLRLINWTSSVIPGPGGTIQYLLGSGTDVTDQHRAEQRSRELLEEASRLQRLLSVDQLAPLLAHELSQPLAALAMYAENGLQMLAQIAPQSDKLSSLLVQISDQSLHAGEIIRRLRQFVSRGRIESTTLDLNATIRQACALMAPRLRSEQVGIFLDLDETLPAVLGDAVHIQQVVFNLVRNALEAITDQEIDDGTICLRSYSRGGMARVSVVDNGPGIDVRVADNLFVNRASTRLTGLGLGLGLSKKLIEFQRGQLWVEPQSRGSSFHFSLPLAS